MSISPAVAHGRIGSKAINAALDDAVRLDTFTLAALNAAGFAAAHQDKIVVCSNGNAGAKCLAYSDGANWKIITLGANIS